MNVETDNKRNNDHINNVTNYNNLKRAKQLLEHIKDSASTSIDQFQFHQPSIQGINAGSNSSVFQTNDHLWKELYNRFQTNEGGINSLERILKHSGPSPSDNASQEFHLGMPEYATRSLAIVNSNDPFFSLSSSEFASPFALDNAEGSSSSSASSTDDDESSSYSMWDSHTSSYLNPNLIGQTNHLAPLASFPVNESTNRKPTNQLNRIRATLGLVPASMVEPMSGFSDSKIEGMKMDLSDMNDGSNLFELQAPLRSKQRKSYERESRYLTPYPVIAIKSSLKDSFRSKNIVKGDVIVELVDGEGNPFPKDHKLFGCSLPGGFRQSIDLHTLTSSRYQLKLYESSGKKNYRLKFIVTYETNDLQHHCEVVYSNVFQVQSCKKRAKRSFPTSA